MEAQLSKISLSILMITIVFLYLMFLQDTTLVCTVLSQLIMLNTTITSNKKSFHITSDLQHRGSCIMQQQKIIHQKWLPLYCVIFIHFQNM